MTKTGLELSQEHREILIRSVIKRAKPRWWKWPFNWFNICPVSDAAKLFEIDWQHRNSAYLLLQSYHCVGYRSIPPEIRKAIPDLIREALSSKVRVICEFEPSGDVANVISIAKR
jgi:hypothetical protein